MNEKPILFNAEMVNAILSGRKTQTRRIMKVQPENPHLGLRRIIESKNSSENGKYFWSQTDACGTIPRSNTFSCPLGKPGDQLWVREAFAAGLCTESTLAYRATHKTEDLEEGWGETIKWTPSIHMPRWASRINLLITGVRVERLNTISTGDAMAEGYPAEREATGGSLDAWLWFRYLWDGIYPDNTFEVNPWCWVIEFERMEAK
ncbi:TPA: hypothetical protein ACF2ZB_003602 [Yersinia enterocolitica]|uniref:hypothetical protein n=1 Tax=Yersinia enterocolitica TaxID=630 RepID=UPI0005DE7B56|nr:hypothetical protein [Yersinia enterocolitica]CQJ08224.1 phage-like protein [Yersinia enterocolitica]HEI6950090.1 hypothetical protein [Yersinia enterocolitica]HEM6609010.1 hypothetical protein [Yersinia enterocolitica]